MYSAVPRCFIKQQIKAQTIAQVSTRRNTEASSSMLPVADQWNKSRYQTDLIKQTVQILSGHGPFPAYLQRFGLRADSQCLCGDNHANAKHYVDECPIMEPARVHLRIKTPTSNNEPSTYLGALLQDFTEPINDFCKTIIKTIREKKINR